MNEEKTTNEKTEPTNFEYGHLYSMFYHILPSEAWEILYRMCRREKEII